ncbi:MAG TPA: type IX secretion system membrane protein PorP/SprF [Bacteroidales bacterium]|nr:type IX secretion system membrane protein PorP/SprF [Bacteroidales bacterium]HOE05083.1 type IX secretion system membrane protein PorP/SprF [Bacteroidales bacterium]HQL70394.1 type IX secretion system membrane protein PorP/SprF [Bacteroidales bacterium]
MKKLLLFATLLLFLLPIAGVAQQLPLYTQYFLNDFVINPAVAGSSKYSPIRLSIHKQWVGINDSPSTQSISGHTMLENKTVGIGGFIFNDHFGPVSHTGLQAVYSYHFWIDRKNRISLGLAAIAFQYKMDQRFFELTTYDDPAITYMIEKTIVPDATFGVYFYGKKYWAGISAAHLFQSKLKINRNLDDNTMVRHYFAMGGYRFDFPSAPQFKLEPSLMLKMTEVTPIQIDFNVKFYYDDDYWFGMSLRPNDAFIAAFGVKINRYYLGYAYDFTFSDLSNYTIGSQEIVFGVNIGEPVKRGRSFF